MQGFKCSAANALAAVLLSAGAADVGAKFLSPDPVPVDTKTAQNFNRYAYANNSPYSFTDPDGRDAVAIVFPEYKIQTPGGKVGGLGHAGVLLIDNQNGATKYYEYGRYNNGEGAVRSRPVPDVTMGKDGRPTDASLNRTLNVISQKAGQGGAIQAAYVPGADFKKMDSFARDQMRAADAKETSYSLTGNNCGTFMQQTIEAGGAEMPWMIDPRPTSYIDEVRDDYKPIDLPK